MLSRNMFSLKKICLYIIAQNFERYYIAFTSSKDEDLQRILEFLQRRYSAQLATGLYIDKSLKKDYFEFLINEHLKFLVGKWFDWESKKSRYLCTMENYFCRLPNLTRVCFRSCTDVILENLVKFCPKLVEIDIRHSSVTDEGIKLMYQMKNGMLPCPELKNVFIWPSSVKDDGAMCLVQNLPSLERFDYPNLPELLYETWKQNSHINSVRTYNLVELDLSECEFSDNYSDILKINLTACNKLDSVSCSILHKQELDYFTNTHLKVLRIQISSKCGEINIDDFLKDNGYNLTCLKISNCSVSTSALAVYCPVLEEFYAHYVNFTDNDDDNLQGSFTCLTKCSFCGHKVSDVKTLRLFLAYSPKLESISLRFLDLSLEMKNCILMWCKNSSLKLVEFLNLCLDEQFFSDILSSCPSLRAMFVNQCFFRIKDVKGFLCNLATKLPNKPKIYLKRNTNLSNMDDYHEMIKSNYDSLFKVSAKNLESDLKEEYKRSNFYDSLFAETAFDRNNFFPNDDWEENWEIIGP